MSSLRAFQSEIDEIHAKNVAEQRAATALASPTEKKGKVKDASDAPKPEAVAPESANEDDDDLAEVQVRTSCSMWHTRRRASPIAIGVTARR